jgi:ABC-type lipoprotein release transport system permease subunit
MAAVGMLARVELRRRWRHVVALTLFVGVAGAVVLALVAGARRTDSSLARFEEASRSANLELTVGDATKAQVDELRASVGVAGVAALRQLTVVLPEGALPPTAAQLDDRFGTDVDRPRVVRGRLPDQDAVDEIAVGEALAERLGLGVGDRLPLVGYSPEDIASEFGTAEPHGPAVDVRVVGVVRRPLDLGRRGAVGILVPTRAFAERYRDEIGSYAGTVLRVRTEHGVADLGAVVRAARRIFGEDPRFDANGLGAEGKVAQDAIDVSTVGLVIAAGVAALASVVALGIALSRVVALSDVEQATLAALGARRRTRATAAAAVGLPVAVVGAVLAGGGAALASPLFPLGIGADAEPDPGVSFDRGALLLGVVAVAVVVLAIAAIAGTRTARIERSTELPGRPSHALRAATKLGAAPPAAAGIRFALDRTGGRPALPVRSSLLGCAVGVLVVVAVMVYAAGFDHLVSTPSAYGWTWDAFVGDDDARTAGDDCAPVTTRLTRLVGFAALASVCTGSVQVAGRPTEGWAYRHLDGGRIGPAIASGRAPATPREVALGRDALDGAGKEVGDAVRITGPERAMTFRIVGTAIFPIGTDDTQPLADGAVFTPVGLASIGPVSGGWNLVARFAPDADRAELVRTVRELTVQSATGEPIVTVGTLPAEIEHVERIGRLPDALAVFVGGVALAAVGFALVTAARRRRHDFAVLATIGFVRRQLRAVMVWQATTIAAVGLAVGIPLGLVVGRGVWAAVAGNLGVSTAPTWPFVGIVLLVPAVVLAVNLVAALPARAAAHTRPAVVLRAE